MPNAHILPIPTPDGASQAYLAESGPNAARAGILLLPEIYNLNTWIKEVAQRYAAQGFTVLVPDLFWRQAAGIDLPYTPEGQQRGRAHGASLERRQAAQDILAVAAWLRQRLAPRTPLAAIGFCLGGELALLAAARPVDDLARLDAAIAYYPTFMERHLDALSNIHIPTLVHIGEHDHRTPPELVQQLKTGLRGNARARVDVHPGADHGFGRFGHPPFHQEAAKRAETSTLDLLDSLPHPLGPAA